jgi:hypothetical protein
MTDFLKLAQEEGLTKYQIWYRNPKNRARVLAKQASLKAKDPIAYSKRKSEEYYKKHAQYRTYYKKWYAEKKEHVRAQTRRIGKTLEGIFRNGRRLAKQRKLSWLVTFEQFCELREKPCFYCGGSLPEYGHGLDRIDNDRGYEMDNILPCCFPCNKHRSDDWTVEEAKGAIEAVLRIRGEK